MKILLADDDRVLTTLLSGRLRSRGVEVVVAHDAMQALMSAMRSPPDAIVLDIQMPGGTGIEALRKLKTSGKTSSIPVIVLSGCSNPAASSLPLPYPGGPRRVMASPVTSLRLHELPPSLSETSARDNIGTPPSGSTTSLRRTFIAQMNFARRWWARA
jgi:CheY-like chemotaxis protein